MNRRKFLKTSASIGSITLTSSFLGAEMLKNKTRASLAFVKTNDRGKGVIKAMDLLIQNQY